MLEAITAGQMVSLTAREPGMIVGPIATFLGGIYNVVFNWVYSLGEFHALGIAIIIFTILVKAVLVPLSYKQQQSTYAMQKLQPEMNKIREKYSKKKDPENQQKMALEIQRLQKDNNVSMFGGCLPLLVQLPILYALFYIFQQAYIYIDVIGANYALLADILLTIPEDVRVSLLTEPVTNYGLYVDVANKDQLIVLINKLTALDWSAIIAGAGEYSAQITEALTVKNSLETFLGINLIQNAGYGFPGILIPLLAGGTTFLSSKILTKTSASTSSNDPNAEMTMRTMKTMNMIMPFMMGFMCITLPAGVGLYWTISNIIQVVQSLLLGRYFKNKDAKA